MTHKIAVTSNIIHTKIHTLQNIHFSENLQNYPASKYLRQNNDQAYVYI